MSYSHNSNLYQWKRFTRRKDEVLEDQEKRKKNMFSDEWVRQKLEMASENALKVAFHGKSSPYGSTDHSDEEYDEANKLLNEWIGTKLHDEFLAEDANFEQNENVKKEHQTDTWYNSSDAFMEHCLKVTDFGNVTDMAVTKQKPQDEINLQHVYAMDESDAASFITKKLLEKPIVSVEAVKKHKKKTIKLKSDPATLMEMRHKAVQESMEKRRQAEQKRQQEKLNNEEAKKKAKELLRQEEQKRLLKIKQEEIAIKKEMVRFRKEFALQKQQQQMARKYNENINAKNSKKEIKSDESSVIPDTSFANKTDDKIFKVKQEININLFELKCRKKTLQIYFSWWYKSILVSRIRMGKAKAMRDWRMTLKSWNAWRKYVQDIKSEEATIKHINEVKLSQKSEKIAQDSNKTRLLRKTFLHWKLWVQNEQEKRCIQEQKNLTKIKMQALIEKVVHEKQKTAKDMILESVEIDDFDLKNYKKDKNAIDKLFVQSKPPQKSAKNKIPLHTVKPKAAWQVSKKHVHVLSEQEIKNIGGPLSGSENVQGTRRRKFDPYDNRQKFQKQMLDEQKNLIQEQKRMIEDLKEERKLMALNNEISGFKSNNHPKYFIDENSQLDSKYLPRDETVTKKGINIQKKTHPIVTAMELRAQERAKRHEELMAKKRKREQEKVEELQKIELERIKQDEEKQRLLKEEKRKEKELKRKLEEDKKIQIEKMKKLNVIAMEHYKKSLLKNYGLKPLKRLVDGVRAKFEVAECHYNDTFMRNTFHAWKNESEQSAEQGKYAAAIGYRDMLLRRVMRHWKAYGKHMEILEQKADMFCNRNLKAKYIRYWTQFATNEKLQEWDNEARAKNHDLKRRKKRVFNIIYSHAKNVKESKQKQETISLLRQHVTRLLPDYNPNLSDSFTNDN